jgi:hypothetical protein
MLDDLDCLRHNPHLLQLLSHYAQPGEVNRETWQYRLTEMAEVEPRDLVKLHGELIAFQWVEQNTGQVPTSYRITLAGLRAMRVVQAKEISDDDLHSPQNQEKQLVGQKRKKNRSSQSPTPEPSNPTKPPDLKKEFTLREGRPELRLAVVQ